MSPNKASDMPRVERTKAADGEYIDPRTRDDVLHSGFYSLDYLLGGGIRSGSYLEFFGKPGAGKTYLCLNIIREAQKKWDGPALWLDYESSWDAERAEQLGVDIDRVHLAKPKNMEQGYKLIEKAVVAGDYCAIVVDSATMMMPAMLAATDMDDSQKFIGTQAKKHVDFLRRINPYLGSDARMVIIFTSQIRDNVGGMQWEPKTKVPGGHGFQHQHHYRLQLSTRKWARKFTVGRYDANKGTKVPEEVEGGHVMVVKLVKSKKGGILEGQQQLIFSYPTSYPNGVGFTGVRYSHDLLAFFTEMDMIKNPSQGWYQIEGHDKKINGKANLEAFFESEGGRNLIEELLPEALKRAEERRKQFGYQMVN